MNIFIFRVWSSTVSQATTWEDQVTLCFGRFHSFLILSRPISWLGKNIIKHENNHYLQSYLEASFSTRLQVRLDVPGVQVGYAHQKARPSEGPQFTETNTSLQESEVQTVTLRKSTAIWKLALLKSEVGDMDSPTSQVAVSMHIYLCSYSNQSIHDPKWTSALKLTHGVHTFRKTWKHNGHSHGWHQQTGITISYSTGRGH